ncbi:protein of unknown function [Paraburkholderia kururiensis]
MLPDHNTTTPEFVIKHYRSGVGRRQRAGKNAFDYRHGTANVLIYLEFTWAARIQYVAAVPPARRRVHGPCNLQQMASAA